MYRSNQFTHPLLLAVGLLLATQSASAIVLVGPTPKRLDGTGCDFTAIQDAIEHVLNEERANPADGVDPYIGVAGDSFYNEALVVDSSNIGSYSVFGTPFNGAFVQIYGNYDKACANDPHDSTLPARIGAGGGKAGNSVLEIKGSSPVHVILNHLDMTDAGQNAAGTLPFGGGISFHASAAGYVELSNVDITGNHASYGGGIYANGHAPGLTVALHAGTTIENNAVTNDGGGILATGETFLYATEGNVVVYNNTAVSAGGGIAFEGHGSVTLGGGVQVFSNQSSDGGGIYVNADSPTDVTFYDSVFVAFNTAALNGGGMMLEGQAKLYAESVASPTQVLLNKVLSNTGVGGGILLRGPAQMRFTGSIDNNRAGYGGGIALLAGHDQSSDNVFATLTAPAPNTPVTVSSNTAYQTGGGIYLKPFVTLAVGGGFDTSAELVATDFRFDLNQAQEGSAIYADEDFESLLGLSKIYVGSRVRLNDSTPPICTGDAGCNEINGNVAATADFQPTDGSTILIQIASTLTANRVALQQNDGGHVIRVVEEPDYNAPIRMGDCLITDNQVTQELVYLESDLDFFNCTLAHNTIGAQHVIRVASDGVSLINSIIDQDINTFDFAGNTNSASRSLLFLLTNHVDSTLTPNPTLSVGVPRFVDVAQRDYHLRPDSPGLDAARADGLHVDRDGHPRDVDLPLVPNFFQSPTNQGFRDLGAYELQLFQLPPTCVRSDTIFCNGFQ